jgi:hypothetical protein
MLQQGIPYIVNDGQNCGGTFSLVIRPICTAVPYDYSRMKWETFEDKKGRFLVHPKAAKA